MTLAESFGDRQIILQAQERAGEGGQPGLVENAASDLETTRVVAAGPLEELEVGRVKRSPPGARACSP